MEVIKGTATSVRYTVNVTGNKNGISMLHHTIFKVRHDDRYARVVE